MKWVLMLYGYSQFLRMRFLASQAARSAWSGLNAWIDRFLSSYAPAIVLRAYRSVASSMYRSASLAGGPAPAVPPN
jgi:hypothetical protein